LGFSSNKSGEAIEKTVDSSSAFITLVRIIRARVAPIDVVNPDARQ